MVTDETIGYCLTTEPHNELHLGRNLVLTEVVGKV